VSAKKKKKAGRVRLPPEAFKTNDPIYERIIELKTSVRRVGGKRAAAIREAQAKVLRTAMVVLGCDEMDPTSYAEPGTPYANFLDACRKLRDVARTK